jgi:hypothetical protein
MTKLLVAAAAAGLLVCSFVDEAFAQRGGGYRGVGGFRGAAIGVGYRGAAFRTAAIGGYGYRGARLGWRGGYYPYRYGYYRGWGYRRWGYYGGGFATGAILGGLIAAPYYYGEPYYYPYEPAYAPAYRYGYESYPYAPGPTQYDRADPSSYYVSYY